MPKRDDAHMAARRQQILEAVLRCIDDKGINGWSIADIAVAAGLSTGAIYTHFGSKEELLTELIERDHENRPLFEGCRTAADTLARCEHQLREFSVRDENTARVRTLFEIAALAHRSEKVRAAVDAGYQGQHRAALAQAALLAHPGLPAARVEVLGECLFGLILSAQLQMLAGVSPDTDAKLRAARALVEELHGGPVKLARRRAPGG